MNYGQMDRGNENPTQHFPWWLRKTTKNPSQPKAALGFVIETSWIRVQCVITFGDAYVIIIIIKTFSYKILFPNTIRANIFPIIVNFDIKLMFPLIT